MTSEAFLPGKTGSNSDKVTETQLIHEGLSARVVLSSRQLSVKQQPWRGKLSRSGLLSRNPSKR
jgi:hypothetical protein